MGVEPLRAPLDPRVLAHVIERYEGDTLAVADCDVPVYHGHGTLVFRTGFTYTGELARGRMHGRGRMEWRESGVVYEGEFSHNEITGRGKFSWPNGSSYEGDVRAGKRHGRGVFYTGTRGALKLGLTIDTSDDSTSPESAPAPLYFSYGHSERGQEEDHGGPSVDDASSESIDAESNARYEGEWVDGLPYGVGTLVFDAARDVRYEGGFVEGNREGRGTMHYASGNVYVGEWKGDLKCGRGVMTWTDALGMNPLERYVGQWANDCQHGFGRHVWLMTSATSSSSGPGSLGNVTPSLTQPAREKNWYEGEFRDGVRCGRGVFYYANGARYEGEWKDNVKEGHGLFFYEDGRVCVGRFQQDRIVDVASTTAAGPGSATTASPSQDLGSAANPAAPPSSTVPPPPAAPSTNSGIILYIRDLFAVDDNAISSKARKAVEHAALHINTEVRTLYRQWIKESRRKDSSRPTEADDSGSVMELSECRHLLSTCGLYISSGQIDDLVRQVRRAQRDTALADTAARSANTLPLDMLAIDLPLQHHLQHPIDPNELEVVPCDQQLLYREFVELLVRLAHGRLSLGDSAPDPAVQTGGTVLADAFTELFGKMMLGRQLSQRDPVTWLSQVRSQLVAKPMQSIFTKHHALLFRLFLSCLAGSSPSSYHQDEDEDIDGLASDPTTGSSSALGCVQRVTIRAVLSMLRRESESPVDPVFSDKFRIRDALQALNQALADALPDAPTSATQHHKPSNNEDARADAFFADSLLVYSEFLDAIAIVQFAKHHGLSSPSESTGESPEQDSAAQIPLHALVDRFLHGLGT